MSREKLKPDVIQRVKDLVVLRLPQRTIADSVGISQSAVNKIKAGCYDTGKYIPKHSVRDDIYDFYGG